MIIEDGREAAQKAIDLMREARGTLGIDTAEFFSVQEFLAHAKHDPLTPSERETIVEQAIELLDQLYVHLPFKRARYAVDPVQRLRLIRSQLKDLEELAFHREMLQVFSGLRDAHTFYGLPEPYRSAVAFLPFRLKCFSDPGDGGRRRFLVTQLIDGFRHPHFGRFAEITAWNGMPVERAIEREGGYDPLGNEAARFARGLQKMSSRSLSFHIPPEEDWVVVQYRRHTADKRKNDERERAILMPWCVATNCVKTTTGGGYATSVNESLLDTREAGKYIWHRSVLQKEKLYSGNAPAAESASGKDEAAQPATVSWSNDEDSAGPATKLDISESSRFPGQFEFRYTREPPARRKAPEGGLHDPAHPDKRFGYVRIWKFGGLSAEEFTGEFQRILRILQNKAPDGLIVDIRSNPGGAVDSAELALGLLSPGIVQLARFHFINSRRTQAIAAAITSPAADFPESVQKDWTPWAKDLISAVYSGSVITPGRELTSSLELLTGPGQCYQGPVTLLTDARSYSAADLFAAGFQDNRVGRIIGVDRNSGGGGANRWLHEELLEKLQKIPGNPLVQLPKQARLGVAIRRSTRVGDGPSAGTVIEDVGVECDDYYAITSHDLMHQDSGLLQFACAQLAQLPQRSLSIDSAALTTGGDVQATVSWKNLHRLEFRLNGDLQCSFAADVASPAVFTIPVKGLKIPFPGGTLRVEGFARIESDDAATELRLVVSSTARWPFPPKDDAPSVPK
ncbi:MAG TPA: S41 family peptidase [Paludibaculum sp.]|jgi:hypothetical protein